MGFDGSGLPIMCPLHGPLNGSVTLPARSR
jgi:hypothetical protein